MPSPTINPEQEKILDQAEKDSQALVIRHLPALVLSLDTIFENVVAVIAGEKRIAVVPRTHPKVKEGPIFELRLVKNERVVLEKDTRVPAAELEELAQDVDRAKREQFRDDATGD